MGNDLLATFGVSEGIAVVAVLIALASLVNARKIAARQRTFELRFYQIRMLDPAKGTLRRIVLDHDQRMNAATHLEGRFSAKALEDLGKLHVEAVTTFHAISHHMPPDKQRVLEARRIALDRKWTRERYEPVTAMQAREMRAYVVAVLDEVEDCLQTLLDKASTRFVNRYDD